MTPSDHLERAATAPKELTRIRNAAIVGLGLGVPERVVTNDDLAKFVDTNDEWIQTRTGISTRRIADNATATSDLALIAAQNALIDAKMDASELDLILCATTSGDYIWPSTACVVQAKLGAKRAGAFDLAAACSGFCYGLAVADGFIKSGMMQKILVIGADTLTKQVNWTDRGTCVLFGDGAGAAVLTACSSDEGILTSVLGADGSGIESVWIPAGGTRTPFTHEVIDNGEHLLRMRGQEVYKFAVNIVPQSISDALDNVCLRPQDVDLLVLHQANARIMSAIAERLEIPPEKVFVNVDRYGNTSAGTIPIALTEAQEQGRLKRGDLVVTCGYGAGLTWATNVMRWGKDQ